MLVSRAKSAVKLPKSNCNHSFEGVEGLLLFSHLNPTISPLANFLWHPWFRAVVKDDNYDNWKKKDLVQFYRLGSGRQMLVKELILKKIGDTSHSWFQYRKVSNLMSVLMKKSNIF